MKEPLTVVVGEKDFLPVSMILGITILDSLC